MKIVLIGAASHSFGLGQIADVLRAEPLANRNMTLSLVDEDAAALDRMLRVARRIKTHTGSRVVLESATDRRAALPGADYVVIAVARKRYELWEQDFRIPLAYGFRHVLGENGGPGALFHALRSFELVIPICRDIEALCPRALVLNFTNPEARVLHAICHLTRVNAVGICHGVAGALQKLSEYLGKPVEEMDIVSAGMNHFYCILKAKDRATGEDLLPKAIRMAAHDSTPGAPPLFRQFARVFDVFTFPSDDHIGEYVAFGSEFHGIQWPYGLENKSIRLAPEPAPDLLEEYASGRLPEGDARILAGSHEMTVPIIWDIELDRGIVRPAVNVLNTRGYIDNLPRDIVVEVPGKVDATGVHPLPVGCLPEAFAAFMRPQFTIHGLVTEAYRTHSKKLLLQALLLDPVVNHSTAAEKMLDQMLTAQKDFLPEFS